VGDGFDGTWVAHPDLVQTARTAFEQALGDHPNQISRQRPDVHVTAAQLIDFRVPGGEITEAGLRTNISVGVQYLASWLRGSGAAAINNLMEDAATAEISRSQVWQWLKAGATLKDGRTVTRALVIRTLDEETENLREALGAAAYEQQRFPEARTLFEQVALADTFPEFLTTPAYAMLA